MADQRQPPPPQADTTTTTTAAAAAATSAAVEPTAIPSPVVPAADDAAAVENPSVFKTISSVALSLATTAVVYAFGYWRIAAVSTWVLLPVMACVSVVRDRWREAGRLKRRRAQLAAAADEKTLVTASVADLPSWVFFPDVHRAEWLNQVNPL